MAISAAAFAARFTRGLFIWTVAILASAHLAMAAPYASLVMDARTGQVLEAENADARLHPASLTKMMTLYIAFQAIKHGEISLDTEVTISAHAANEQPSKLGMRPGQKIKLRYLIRAAAIKSANDCATAIGEAIEGSEAKFADRMNRTAKQLGMTRTTFKNANGLTAAGHLSTARDMTILARHLFYDHPEYYNLFSRRTADAGGKTVRSTNAKFLDAYPGADGIKTGYTAPSGFNLVGSAQHGNVRIIATVFGGTSTAQRNAKVAELLDLGFSKAPSRVKEQPPKRPNYADPMDDSPDDKTAVGPDEGETDSALAAKSLRVSGLVQTSPRPHWRAGPAAPAAPPTALLAAMHNDIQDALAAVQQDEAPTDAAPLIAPPPPERPDHGNDTAQLSQPAGDAPQMAALAPETGTEDADAAVELADAALPVPAPEVTRAAQAPADRPAALAMVAVPAADDQTAALAVPPSEAVIAAAEPASLAPETTPDLPVETADASDTGAVDADGPLLAEADEVAGESLDAVPLAAPTRIAEARNDPAPALTLASIEPESFSDAPRTPVVVTRLSTSGGRHWGINVGTYNTQYEAEKVLLKTALIEIDTLDSALRKVARGKTGFEANFVGMSQRMADLACQRLSARSVPCTTLGPTG